MNQIIAAIAALVTRFTNFREADVEKAAVKALVTRLDASAKRSYARADALVSLSTEIATAASAEKSFAKDVNALAGRLEKAIG